MLGAGYVTLKTRPQGANLAVTEMGVCTGSMTRLMAPPRTRLVQVGGVGTGRLVCQCERSLTL